MNEPFKLGDRVSDPTISLAGSNERYRLNANILPADAELLKLVSLNRGTIQLVTANLLHSFCNTLRQHGITNRAHLDKFHCVLRAFCGGDLDEVSYAQLFGCGPHDRQASGVCGGAAALTNRQEPSGHDIPRVDATRGVAEAVSQVATDTNRQTQKGRGENGQRVRSKRGEDDKTKGKQDARGADKASRSKRGGARGKTGR